MHKRGHQYWNDKPNQLCPNTWKGPINKHRHPMWTWIWVNLLQSILYQLVFFKKLQKQLTKWPYFFISLFSKEVSEVIMKLKDDPKVGEMRRGRFKFNYLGKYPPRGYFCSPEVASIFLTSILRFYACIKTDRLN